MTKPHSIIIIIVGVVLLVGRVPVKGQALACEYDLSIDTLLGDSDLTSWLYWVEVLSGEQPAQLDGFPHTIRTRNTMDMFNGSADARAYDYVLQQISNWYPESALIQQSYPYVQVNAKNLIVTIPGKTFPDEYVLLVAHLDDTAWNSTRLAPGANDNAIGVATLLEAARLYRQHQFD